MRGTLASSNVGVANNDRSTKTIEPSADLFGKYRNDVVETHLPSALNTVLAMALLAVDAIESQKVTDSTGRQFPHRTINLSGVLFDENGERLDKFTRIQLVKACMDLFEKNGKLENNEAMQTPFILPWANGENEGEYKSQIRIYFGATSFLVRAEPYGTVDKYDQRLQERMAAYARGEKFTMSNKNVDAGF